MDDCEDNTERRDGKRVVYFDEASPESVRAERREYDMRQRADTDNRHGGKRDEKSRRRTQTHQYRRDRREKHREKDRHMGKQRERRRLHGDFGHKHGENNAERGQHRGEDQGFRFDSFTASQIT